MKNFDPLFEPLKVGPILVKNRFFAEAHGVGYGHRDISSNSAIRKVKAEGGWGVVCTEQAEIHTSTDMSPHVELRAWGDDVGLQLSKIASSIKSHGATAAIELSHSGSNVANLSTRATPIGPSTTYVNPSVSFAAGPFFAKEADLDEIESVKRWYVEAAMQAVEAGFELVHVYAAQYLTILHQFLSSRRNFRSDIYGGNLPNRVRLLKDVVRLLKEAVGSKCAVGVRLSIEEFVQVPASDPNSIENLMALVGEEPDLWDVLITTWGGNMSGTGRFDFSPEDNLQHLLRFKRLTSKPVVASRFFDTPDKMLEFIERGYVDFVGIARQSISDPFLPNKIRAGKLSSIRPCIKCNLCVAHDLIGVPVRCTQNPTFGEEHRNNWHPEKLEPGTGSRLIEVVGGGLAGIEAARVLALRGFDVNLYEKETEFGGNIRHLSRLPGLSRFFDLVKYRMDIIRKLKNVSLRPQTTYESADFFANKSDLVIATGARWRRDIFDRSGSEVIKSDGSVDIITPDEIFYNVTSKENIVIFDLENFVFGGAIADYFASLSANVTLVTSSASISSWTTFTMEQHNVQAKLLRNGVNISTGKSLSMTRDKNVITNCIYTNVEERIPADCLIIVGQKACNESLYRELKNSLPTTDERVIEKIGSARVPGIPADSIRSGYAFGVNYNR